MEVRAFTFLLIFWVTQSLIFRFSWSIIVPPEKVDATFRVFKSQKGKDGHISRETFIRIMTSQAAADVEFAQAIFDSFDKDNSG